MSKKITALIVDDEPLARDTVRLLLEARDDVEIVGEAEDGRKAVEEIVSKEPDLVFLDIQMPEMDGFGVIESVGTGKMPVVIFATAFDQYAIKAFEAQALDYILKPFDDERFNLAVDRAISKIQKDSEDNLQEKLGALLEAVDKSRDADFVERIMIKEKDLVVFVKTEDIDWVESAGDYVVIRAGGKKHLLRESMTNMEKKLDPEKFARIHRSTILNLDRIKELRPYFHGDYIVYLKDGNELKLSRRYWKKLESVLER